MENEIKVSVSMISYKHAKYIRRCLDSVLAQKVNFKYEIVVGEDCSQDGTREILLEYKEKYPDIFVLLLNEKNMGVSANSMNVASHLRGKYICGCETDDYWLDENRMQKQVDYLDAHPEVAGVAGNYCSVDEEGNNPRVILSENMLNKHYTLEDYLHYGMTLHGNTIMRRREVTPIWEEKYRKLKTAEPTMGDIITRVLLHVNGGVYALPDMFLAHRESYSAGTSYTELQKTKMIYYSYMYCRIVDNIEAYLDHKYDLSEMKANRTAGMMLMILLGKRKVDRKELREYMNSLPPKVRRWSYWKLAVKLWNKIKKRLRLMGSGAKVENVS